MKFKIIVLLIFVLATSLYSQNQVTGTVKGNNEGGNSETLAGATIQWLGSKVGTQANTEGKFKIPTVKETDKLVVSFIGYKTDTITVNGNKSLEIMLKPEAENLAQVEVVGKQEATQLDYLSTRDMTKMTENELFKAACCNLSESFETNPSIDVSFSDAITGTKQIEMLGLAGTYTQITLENMPYIRGLTSNIGLTYIPGTWIESINVSKGMGSVANGFESITGQIDVDLRKPFKEAEKTVFLNLYTSSEQRYEGNLNLRLPVSQDVYSMTLLHASTQQHMLDVNNDRFIDMPTFKTVNLLQRFHINLHSGWEMQVAAQYVKDEKEGGTRIHSDEHVHPDKQFLYSSSSENIRLHGKTGYVFPNKEYQSFGFQWALSKYTNSSSYGGRIYDGSQKSGYFNFLFQSQLGSEKHKYRLGLSYMFDEYDDKYAALAFNRIERVPGAFVEYTYSPDPDEFSIVAGLRTDYHNFYGTMITPRLHFRYSPHMDWVFRGVAGRGFRTSNIFAEYSQVFVSAREMKINQVNNFGFGLEQEKGWNFGLSLTHYFYFEYREATISVDFYRTQFDMQTIADLDTNPQKINFYSIENGSYSNALQVELNFKPFEFVDARLAYRYLDVQQKISGEWYTRPLQSAHRALVTLSYATEKEEETDPQMLYDLTFQWFGPKRIPSTKLNPVNLRVDENSPGFVLLNAQITRSFRPGFDLYIGAENLLDFRQDNQIIDAANPNSPYFDASMVWGPISGRMFYAGLRFRL